MLIVENDFAIGFGLMEDFENLGVRTSGPLVSSAETLIWLGGNKPDLAVLDVRLRDGPSLTVARELRRRGVPFVLFSESRGPAAGPNEEFLDVPWIGKLAPLTDLLAALRTASGTGSRHPAGS